MLSPWAKAPTQRAFARILTSPRIATLKQAVPRGPRNTITRGGSKPFARRPVPATRAIPSQVPPPQTEYNPQQQQQPNSLLAPVHIPEDPNGVINERHPAASILGQSGLVVQRQLEMMNVMLGWEQANRYTIHDAGGNHVGYMAEQDGVGRTMSRQFLKTHRAFTTHIFDKHEREVLRFHRPFSWINSRIRVYDPTTTADGRPPTIEPSASTSLALPEHTSAHLSPLPLSQMRVIGETQQRWAPLRRKYDLFLFRAPPNSETLLSTQSYPSQSDSNLAPSQQTDLINSSNGEYYQFAYVNEPFLSWDFSLLTADDKLIGSVNRNFAGFAREIFTDTGVYALRMDSAGLAEESQQKHLISHTNSSANTVTAGMTYDQRALMLATAVTIDFDYFSRHSSAGSGGFMPIPLWIPGVGGEAAAGGAAAGGAAAGEAGAIGAGIGAGEVVGAAGTAARGVGIGEGAAAMGGLAGYEAMQRGVYGSSDGSGAQAQSQSQAPSPQQTNQWGDPVQEGEELWSQDPWGDQSGQGQGQNGSNGGGEGGGGWGDWGDGGDFF